MMVGRSRSWGAMAEKPAKQTADNKRSERDLNGRAAENSNPGS